MNRIVRYHNDLNKVGLPFTELQHNVFIGLIFNLKDKIKNGNGLAVFTAQEINEFVKDNGYTNRQLFEVVDGLKHNLLKADFTTISQVSKNTLDTGYHNIFKTFWIRVNVIDNSEISTDKLQQAFKMPNGMIFQNFEHLRIEINPDFEHIIDDINSNFTRFEFAEFISLSGKYTKTLYRLLKQYRNTGYMRTEWQDFMRIMDIPYTRQTDIDQFILKPAIKELTKPRNLFDKERVPFKNLKYTKIKGKGRGRGGNVVAIEFRFDIENLEQELLESNHFFDEKFKAEVDKAKRKYLSKNGEWLYINNITYADSKIIFNLYHKDTNKYFSRTYTKDEYERDIKPFIINADNMQKVF